MAGRTRRSLLILSLDKSGWWTTLWSKSCYYNQFLIYSHLTVSTKSHAGFTYPVRCAHNPPPCHFISWIFLISGFLFLGFSWFWVVRFMILGSFRVPGAHFGNRGPILKISLFFVILRTLPARKNLSFWAQNAHQNPVFVALFFKVFLSAHFSWFFAFWGARRCHFEFISTSFWEPWAPEKSAESV